MNLSVFYDITERKRAEEERLRLVHDLEERVKELAALYSAARIFQHQRTIQEVLREIVAILPPAWQYPGITAARIVYDGREYRASGFSVGAWSQSADFFTIDGKRGTIEVFYVEETPPEADGPFLAEERDLISLAGRDAVYLLGPEAGRGRAKIGRVGENGQSYCRVSVEDNGPGIPDDNKGTIFNRALMSTSKAKGMGLGLYLVKSLVDGYNGRVWVEDRIAGDQTRYARFVVLLPALDK